MTLVCLVNEQEIHWLCGEQNLDLWWPFCWQLLTIQHCYNSWSATADDVWLMFICQHEPRLFAAHLLKTFGFRSIHFQVLSALFVKSTNDVF